MSYPPVERWAGSSPPGIEFQSPPAKFRDRRWLHALLFALTALTTTLVGLGHYAAFLSELGARTVSAGWASFGYGAWYSATILAILGAHEFGHYSQPYLVNRIRFLQRKGAGIRFDSLADLYPHSIAVVRGYAYSAEFDGDERLRKVGVGGFATAARMLHAGRVQLTLDDELVARYHLGRELRAMRDELEFLPLPLSENGLHILVRRSHPEHREIARRFDRAIQAMSDDGSYAATFRRHGL